MVHWDALSTAVQYSSSQFAAHNGSLIHGHTTAHFDVNAALAGGEFQENVPFTLHFDIRNADVAEFARWPESLSRSPAALDMSATVSGTRDKPHGDGHLELRNGIGLRRRGSFIEK